MLYEAYVKGKGKPASQEHPRMRVRAISLERPLQNSPKQATGVIVSRLERKFENGSRRLIVSERSQKNEYNARSS